jgi:hypothetical protein
LLGDFTKIIATELNNSLWGEKNSSQSDFKIIFQLTATDQASAGSYRLKVRETSIEIVAAQPAGLYYGWQTLLQLFFIWHNLASCQELDIEDVPAYKKRSFMADMGRSIFPLPMLKRLVRILAKLKMNQLHLHLYDDELCGLIFKGHPFGSDNPYAITLEEFTELICYAKQYHVEIIPELESWAHVGSIVYHRPELRGGDGVYNGSSLLISEESFTLMSDLIRQVATVMPADGTIHLGLDEAKWFLADTMPPDYTPENLFIRYYELIQEINRQQNKNLTMRMWHDHKGRFIPTALKDKIIVEPWGYWGELTEDISQKVAYFTQSGMRWMIGGGQSMGQFRGAYHATRYWCREALNSDNVEGINLTFWGRNDLENHLITLFAGACFAWNPLPNTEYADLGDYEAFDRIVFPIMRQWQSNFSDAFPDNIIADRGPSIYAGFFWGGARHNQPLSPSATVANTTEQHDFINEIVSDNSNITKL